MLKIRKMRKSPSVCKKVSKPKERRSASKKIVIVDLATEQQVLARPEPEFKDKVVIHDDGHAVLKSEQVFMCDEPGCNLLYANAELLRRHMSKHDFDRRIKCEFCITCFKSIQDKSEHLKEFHPDLEAQPEADTLQCKKCRRVCTSAFTLSRHIRRAHKTKKHPCPYCGFEYKHLEDLRQHQLRKHVIEGVSTPTYPCEICGRIFKYKTEWRKHILKYHRNDKEYKCVLCNTFYFCRQVYKNHLMRHTRLKLVSCDVCNIKFLTQYNLRKHSRTLRHKKLVAISQQQRRYNNEEMKLSLTNVLPERKTPEELKQMKTEELIYFCSKRVPKIVLHRVDRKIKIDPSCQKIRKSRGNSDLSKKQFYLKCVYCDQAFPSVNDVDTHEKICLSERTNNTHTCSVCNKSFKKRSLLKKHSLSHSTERPYKCHYCDVYLKTKRTLLVHEKSVHFGVKCTKDEERTFTCPYENCGKTCSCKKNLTRHVETCHLQVKYPCKDCERIFRRKDQLRKHEEKEHVKELKLILECKPCNKTFANKSFYNVHSKGVRHKKKMKEFARLNTPAILAKHHGTKCGK